MQLRNVVADDLAVCIPRIEYSDRAKLNRQTAFNREAVIRSERCGCFYCGSSFAGSEVTHWLKEEDGDDTALCPYCGKDTVITGTKKFPLTTALLTALYQAWFGEEYRRRESNATDTPCFYGRESFFRRGIPFLWAHDGSARQVGQLYLSPPGYYEDGRGSIGDKKGFFAVICACNPDLYRNESKIPGGTVSLHICLDDKGERCIDILDEAGNIHSYRPRTEQVRDQLLDLIETYGDRLRGAIISPNDWEMRLFVSND